MTTALSIDQVVTQTLTLHYPDLNLNPLLRPVFDLQQGHLQSAIAQTIAGILKVEPDKVAKTFVPALQQSLDAQVSFVSGYINLTFNQFTPELFALEVKSEPSYCQIFVVADCERLTSLEYLRFIARPFLQAYLAGSLGHVVEFKLGEKCWSAFSKDLCLQVFWQIFIQLRCNERQLVCADQIEQQIKVAIDTSASNSFMWLAARSLEKKRFSKVFQLLQGSAINFQCPKRSLAVGLETDGIMSIDREHSLSLLLLLSSNEPGRSLDWYVAQSRELANLEWYVQSTLERLGRYEDKLQALGGDSIQLIDWQTLNTSEQELLVRALQIPRFSYFAATAAEISVWHRAVNDFLARTNRAFNSPETRRVLDSFSSLNQPDLIIFSVVYRALYSIYLALLRHT